VAGGGGESSSAGLGPVLYIIIVLVLLFLLVAALCMWRRRKRDAEQIAMTVNSFKPTQSARVATATTDNFRVVAKPAAPTAQLLVNRHSTAQQPGSVVLDDDLYVAPGGAPMAYANATFIANSPDASAQGVYGSADDDVANDLEYAVCRPRGALDANAGASSPLADRVVAAEPDYGAYQLQTETDAETNAVSLRIASIRRSNPAYSEEQTPSPAIGGVASAFAFSEEDEMASAAASGVIPNRYAGEVAMSPIPISYHASAPATEPDYLVPTQGDPAPKVYVTTEVMPRPTAEPAPPSSINPADAGSNSNTPHTPLYDTNDDPAEVASLYDTNDDPAEVASTPETRFDEPYSAMPLPGLEQKDPSNSEPEYDVVVDEQAKSDLYGMPSGVPVAHDALPRLVRRRSITTNTLL
jgi:hypothetical protein